MNKISIVVLFVSLNSFGAAFTHKFEGVPKKYSNCHEEAAELGRFFLEQTGNNSGVVACMKDDGNFSNYELSYTAEKRLPFATTDIFSVYNDGIYKAAKGCEENLSKDIEKFERNSELRKFTAYCRRSSESSTSRWFPFVFAFGQAKKNYFISGYSYFSVPYKFDAQGFIESLKFVLEQKGADFSNAVSVSSLGYGTMQIHYYAKEKTRFELLELIKSPKIEQCLANLDRFNLALKKAGIQPVTSYCGQISVGASWELTTLFADEVPVTTRPSVEAYKTLELCEADRDRLTQYYISSLDKRILDGYCAFGENIYRVLFIRTK